MADLLLLFDGFKMDLGESGFYALLGLVMVFVGIALLVLILWLLGKIIIFVKSKAERSADPKQEKSSASEDGSLSAAVQEEGISPETVAVIAAAVAAYLGSGSQNGAQCDFVVRRIRKL